MINFTNFRHVGRVEYEPDVYLTDPVLKARLATRPQRERQAIAELLHGHMYVHAVYCARPGQEAASFLNSEMVPFLLNAPAVEAAQRLRTSASVAVRFSSRTTLAVTPSEATLACLAFVDGERPLAEVWSQAAAALKQDADEIASAAAPDLDRFNAFNWLCLRHRSCPQPPSLVFGFRGDAVPIAD